MPLPSPLVGIVAANYKKVLNINMLVSDLFRDQYWNKIPTFISISGKFYYYIFYQRFVRKEESNSE
jgi:hypothetical protein